MPWLHSDQLQKKPLKGGTQELTFKKNNPGNYSVRLRLRATRLEATRRLLLVVKHYDYAFKYL